IAERVAALQTVGFRHTHVLEGNLAVLDHFERNLVLYLFDAKAGRSLVLDDEALDLVVGDVARPDDGNITPWRVANPALLAVENPAIPFAFGGRSHSSARSRTHQRLSEAEATDLFPARHRRQPFLFLLLRSIEIDRAHC